MAGIFQSGVWSCGFDFFANGNGAITAGGVFDQIGGSNAVQPAYARVSGKGVSMGPFPSWVGRSFGVNLATHCLGVGFLATGLPIGSSPGNIITWMDTVANTPQVSLGLNQQGQLQFFQTGGLNGFGNLGTPIGSQSATGTIKPNSYIFLEFIITISATVGVLTCYVNGNSVISFSGNTRTTANSFINLMFLGVQNNSGASYQFDDLYILDTTGTSPLNTVLGPGRVQTDGPNAGSATGGLNAWAFTTPAGSDFANCANIPPNAAQYNSDAVLNDRMSFRFPALSTTKVFFLNSWFNVEEDAAGSRAVTPIYRSNNVDQSGTAVVLPQSYTYFNQPSTVDPNTSAGWAAGTVAAAGSAEIGLKVTT